MPKIQRFSTRIPRAIAVACRVFVVSSALWMGLLPVIWDEDILTAHAQAAIVCANVSISATTTDAIATFAGTDQYEFQAGDTITISANGSANVRVRIFFNGAVVSDQTIGAGGAANDTFAFNAAETGQFIIEITNNVTNQTVSVLITCTPAAGNVNDDNAGNTGGIGAQQAAALIDGTLSTTNPETLNGDVFNPFGVNLADQLFKNAIDERRANEAVLDTFDQINEASRIQNERAELRQRLRELIDERTRIRGNGNADTSALQREIDDVLRRLDPNRPRGAQQQPAQAQQGGGRRSDDSEDEEFEFRGTNRLEFDENADNPFLVDPDVTSKAELRARLRKLLDEKIGLAKFGGAPAIQEAIDDVLRRLDPDRPSGKQSQGSQQNSSGEEAGSEEIFDGDINPDVEEEKNDTFRRGYFPTARRAAHPFDILHQGGKGQRRETSINQKSRLDRLSFNRRFAKNVEAASFGPRSVTSNNGVTAVSERSFNTRFDLRQWREKQKKVYAQTVRFDARGNPVVQGADPLIDLPGFFGDNRFNIFAASNITLGRNDAGGLDQDSLSYAVSGGVSWLVIPRLNIGIAGRYSNGDVDSAISAIDTATWGIAGFAQTQLDIGLGKINLEAIAAYSRSEIDSLFNNAGVITTTDTNATAFSSQVKASTLFKIEKVSISPFASLSYINTDRDSFTLSDGQFAPGLANDQVVLSAGSSIATSFLVPETELIISPSLGLGVFGTVTEGGSIGLSANGGLGIRTKRGLSSNLGVGFSGLTGGTNNLSFSSNFSLPLN